MEPFPSFLVALKYKIWNSFRILPFMRWLDNHSDCLFDKFTLGKLNGYLMIQMMNQTLKIKNVVLLTTQFYWN